MEVLTECSSAHHQNKSIERPPTCLLPSLRVDVGTCLRDTIGDDGDGTRDYWAVNKTLQPGGRSSTSSPFLAAVPHPTAEMD